MSEENNLEDRAKAKAQTDARSASSEGLAAGNPSSKFERLEAKIDAIVERLPVPHPQKSGHRFANWLETGWGTRIVAALGAWLILLTIVAFWGERVVRSEERQARVEEAEFRRLAQIATAWEVLLTRSGGDIGKGNALNTLIAAGHTIGGANLSCDAVGVVEDGLCINPPEYNNVVLGDGDFWADDPDRLDCSFNAIGCYVPYYMDEVNFSGAGIEGLVAEKLRINDLFEGVRGEDWVVRNATSPHFDMSWASINPVRNAAAFRCDDCAFYDSNLSWDVVQGFSSPTLVNSTIRIPDGMQIPSETEFEFTAYLDALPVFRRDGIQQAVANTWEDETLAFDPAEYIEWSIYEGGRYCITIEDARRIQPFVFERLEQMRAQSIISQADYARESHLDGRKPRSVDLFPVVIMSARFDDDPRSEDFYVEGLFWRWGDQKHEMGVPESRNYNCGVPYVDVEPLIRERLVDRLALENWN